MSSIVQLVKTTSPSANQPDNSKIPLWEHQKKMLYRCLEIEKAFNEIEKHRQPATNPTPQTFGIMADKPGTGKTYGAVSLILSDLKNSTNQCNLIVVPQNIYTQWDKAITEFCDLNKVRYKTFTQYSDISSLYSNPDILKSVDILLTTSLYYHMICGTINTLNKACGLTIGRVFFDEIDSINSMLREPVQSNFTWFISASFKGDKIGCYNVDKISERTCKCEDDLIDASFNLKPPVNHEYKCTSVYTEMVKDIVSENKLAELNALDFNTNIYKFITLVPRDERDFVYYLLLDINEICKNSTNNIKSLMLAKTQIEECGFYSGQILQFKINAANNQIRDAQNSISGAKGLRKTICERLTQKSICPITFTEENGEEKIVSKCCHTIYNKQILEKIKTYNCPICECELTFPGSFVVEKKLIKAKAKTVQPLDNDLKIFKFMKLIDNMDKDKKVIIFSDYPTVFKNIELYFKHKNIKFVSLDGGSIEAIDKSVKGYKEGDSTVLLADSSMYGCGMNFENTTDLIFMHKINPEMEKQVIGRAQRPGRKGVLQIHRLLNPNEQ
jgi:SNF2 family DNA or RNA helicase